MSPVAYIGFGSNLGNREATFHQALDALKILPGTTALSWSRLYETDPVGLSDEGSTFMNAAIRLETDLSPRDLIEDLRRTELRLGKSPRHTSDRSRVIDLDLLLYDGEHISEDDLEVPHPRMHERAFVLAPLAEIAPTAVHPVLARSVSELLRVLPASDLAGVRPA